MTKNVFIGGVAAATMQDLDTRALNKLLLAMRNTLIRKKIITHEDLAKEFEDIKVNEERNKPTA